MNLTFLNATFLFGAAAAILPLIIHLLSRRRAETVDFSSLRFLRELERRQIRRVRIRQILLLIVRSLIILAIAVALARPTISGPLAVGGGHARTSVAIVLDQSASMSREGEARSLVDEAVGAALDVSGLLSEGDQAFLVTAGSPPASVLAGGTFSRLVLAEAIGETRPSAAATDYTAAIELALEQLAGARNLNRELYVIGDLQRTGWAGGSEGDVVPLLWSASGPGAPPVAYLFPLSGPVGNLGVVSVLTQKRYAGASGVYSITAEIANGSRRRMEVPVRLFVDGVQVGHSGVDLAPGERGSAQFSASVDERAWHSGWVELPPDVMESDDRRYFVIPPVRAVEVLIVEPDGEAGSADGYYVRRALDPTGDGERFHPFVVPASDLAAQEVGRFPAVVLADVGRLDAAAVRWLDSHVASGGGLFVILGDRTDVRAWNDGEVPGSDAVRLVEPFERPSGVRLAPSGLGHPLLDGLVLGARLIDDIDVRRGFVAEGSGVEEVLEFPGLGAGLLVERGSSQTGAGEVAVLLTAIDSRWNDLPRSGFLVPLVHRVVEQVAGASSSRRDVLVGDDLASPSLDADARGVEVILPDGSAAMPERRAGANATAVLRGVEQPGVYSFTSEGKPAALGVVNVDPRESDLTPAGEDAVQRYLRGLECRFVDAGGDVAAEILEARHGRELWRVFVYVALGLLALEMYLSRQRG